MRPRRVVVCGPALGAVSGVSTHVRTLLGSELAREFDLLHFQVGSEGRRESPPQKLVRLALSPLQLALVLLRSGAHTVHLNPSLNARSYWRDLVYWQVAKLLGRRVVTQVHGGVMPQELFHGNAPLEALLRRFLVGSDAVTVLSLARLRAVRAFDPRIAVRLVPNAIEPDGLLEAARAPNAAGPLRLVYLGRLVRAKGLFEALEALAELKRAGRRFVFTVAGDGADAGALQAAARRAGLADRVRFAGTVFGAAKRALWLDSDVLVFPSYTEALPYALLEAMAAGCVPIATDVGAIPDVARHGEHGLLVPVRDARALARALALLDEDRSALARMSEAGRRRVRERYTVKRLARELRELYVA